MKNALGLLLLALCAPSVFASDAPVPSAAATAGAVAAPEFGVSVVRMVVGLLVVLALLVVGMLLIRRFQTPRGAMAGMKIVGAVAVGQRERVVMLEVADKVLLLGVTASQVNTLHTLDKADLPAPAGEGARGGEFAKLLGKKMEPKLEEAKAAATAHDSPQEPQP